MKEFLWFIYILAMIRTVSYGYYEGKKGKYTGMAVIWTITLLSVVCMGSLLGVIRR
ncbi:MAG: hypothetical protein J1F64_03405 [Oscillospiraceae bacterium]|nr:hypothetical protein [Oscillospiraceae bacterium]